jgi:alanine-glyoxylate transaminase/serine-glyoxylate transaminase/serine-pyruvate transaminase
VDGWGIDAIYSGSQKCLSAPPGLSPLSLSERATEAVRARKTPVQSWFLDVSLVMAYWDGAGGRSYHHTAPVNMLYGLHEALTMLHEEGLENAWTRHRANHERLRDGLQRLGLDLLVDERFRLPQLNAVIVPDGVDEADVRRTLLEKHGIEIGAGLGPLAGKIWRIGLMGASSRPEAVDRVLDALSQALGRSA